MDKLKIVTGYDPNSMTQIAVNYGKQDEPLTELDKELIAHENARMYLISDKRGLEGRMNFEKQAWKLAESQTAPIKAEFLKSVPYYYPQETDVFAFRIEAIAKICHEANRAFSATLADQSHAEWEYAEQSVVDSAIRGVGTVLENPNITPAELHQIWVDSKLAQGYVYGEVKDHEKKTHPSLVPFDQLTKTEQIKYAQFIAIVNAHR